jgi:cobalt-zinc-cadmium efflux system membrane fusion protein
MTPTAEGHAPIPADKKPLVRTLLAGLPTFLVLAALTAVGIWGHRTGWSAPKFSRLFGRSPQASHEDWCAAHNVPDSKCIACHPELAGEDAADWCKEHGVPESRCTICHPEILKTGVAADWCQEHGLPESGCTICHPEIARAGELPPGREAITVTAPESTQARDPKTCQKHLLKVQFASPASVAKAGVALGQVVERPMSDRVSANAAIDYDRTRFARLASRAPGTVWRAEKTLGDPVRAGDVLALVDSADVGRAKGEYLQAAASLEVAKRALERIQRSSEAGFRTEVERLAAEAQAQEAGIRLFRAGQALLSLGLPVPEGAISRESIAALRVPEPRDGKPAAAASANLLAVLAPFDGVVVSPPLVAGQVVERTDTLYEVADTRRMWMTMDVAAADVRRIALGQPAFFRPDDAQDEAATGTVSWIATAVDETTRTVAVRAEVENPTGALRAHTFGRAEVVVRSGAKAIAVPNEALQWEGCCHVVFVRLTDEIFQTRKVRLGAKDAAFTEVLAGVLPGEVVATAGSHVLKSEIEKSNLGAGCCGDR